MLNFALAYARNGYPVFQVAPNTKVPLKGSSGCLDATIDEAKIIQWWTEMPNANIGIACRDLVVIDLDGPFEHAELSQTSTVSSTPRGGRHYLFKAPLDKKFKNSTSKLAHKVDTRAGPGGYIVAAPSVTPDGSYKWLSGVVAADTLPILPDGLKQLMIDLGMEENKVVERTRTPRIPYVTDLKLEQRAIAYISKMPEAISGQCGHSKAYAVAVVLVHGFRLSTDVAFNIFKSEYNPRCDPEWSDKEIRHKIDDADRKQHGNPYGWLADKNNMEDISGVDLSLILSEPREETGEVIPTYLLRVPGFISELMDFTMETAPYPNQVMSFCGALAMQCYLAGRKVRDSGDNRTNIYLLGLANSGAGKDWPRKVNVRLAHALGLISGIGESIASGEGLQDALLKSPCMLVQTDEMDSMLQTINHSEDARFEVLMKMLLSMYSSASSVFPMRLKAGSDGPAVIDQPCLTLMGSAIPKHYYDALSARMLTSGFFARFMVFESGKRSSGQEPKIREIPDSLMQKARLWRDKACGSGNMASEHPEPAIVNPTQEAACSLRNSMEASDDEYKKAEQVNDAVGMTVWARANEHIRKLALVYAISENVYAPLVSVSGVEWATELVMFQTNRMLYQAKMHVSESGFHKDTLMIMQLLESAPGKAMTNRDLLRKAKGFDRGRLKRVTDTLVESEEIENCFTKGEKRKLAAFRLISGDEE